MRNSLLPFLKQIFIPKNHKSKYSRIFWVGASIGVVFFTVIMVLLKALNATYGIEKLWIVLLSLPISALCFVVFAILSQLVLRSTKLYPTYFITAIGGSIGILISLKEIGFRFPNDFYYFGGLLALVAFTMVFGGLFILLSGQINKIPKISKWGIMIGLGIGIGFISYSTFWLIREGNRIDVNYHPDKITAEAKLSLADPSQKGNFTVKEFTYGSGINKQRAEFGKDVDYTSEMINGRFILPEWKKKQAKKRSWYWGFGIENWPLNARTWMPDGQGLFPIVLIVHGNHNMEEYSDPGYAYLGEHLASRGYITVSIDENFINGSWAGDFRGKELPARAWLILKHLEQWRIWNNNHSHPFFGKVDLNNVALIGHSRGGEAVSIAAAFNQLSQFPDDAREKFNFNFGIKAVVAIAPTDYRYDRRVQIENIDFLGIQGSYDSDEDSFYGLRQLQRTHFNNGDFHFKSGVYIHGANHGQFNSIWGRHDAGFPYNLFLNTKPMISEEQQRQYAKVLISAFLEASIKRDTRYCAVFQDLRQADNWLPKGQIAISLYEDTRIKYWADFEEDIELSTTGIGKVSTDGFDFWAEDYLQFRAGMHQENHAVVLGWCKDSVPAKANYTIAFDRIAALSEKDFITLSVAAGNPSLLENGTIKDDSLRNDVSIILEDSLHYSSQVRLSDFRSIPPRLNIRFLKTKKLTKARYKSEWEPVFQTIFIPITAFNQGQLDLSKIASISIQADTKEPGIVLLDRIGLLQTD